MFGRLSRGAGTRRRLNRRLLALAGREFLKKQRMAYVHSQLPQHVYWVRCLYSGLADILVILIVWAVALIFFGNFRVSCSLLNIIRLSSSLASQLLTPKRPPNRTPQTHPPVRIASFLLGAGRGLLRRADFSSRKNRTPDGRKHRRWFGSPRVDENGCFLTDPKCGICRRPARVDRSARVREARCCGRGERAKSRAGRSSRTPCRRPTVRRLIMAAIRAEEPIRRLIFGSIQTQVGSLRQRVQRVCLLINGRVEYPPPVHFRRPKGRICALDIVS